MKIEKECDLNRLVNNVNAEIERAGCDNTFNVDVSVFFLEDIFEVLKSFKNIEIVKEQENMFAHVRGKLESVLSNNNFCFDDTTDIPTMIDMLAEAYEKMSKENYSVKRRLYNFLAERWDSREIVDFNEMGLLELSREITKTDDKMKRTCDGKYWKRFYNVLKEYGVEPLDHINVYIEKAIELIEKYAASEKAIVKEMQEETNESDKKCFGKFSFKEKCKRCDSLEKCRLRMKAALFSSNGCFGNYLYDGVCENCEHSRSCQEASEGAWDEI